LPNQKIPPPMTMVGDKALRARANSRNPVAESG
jgi:hypothetical protein